MSQVAPTPLERIERMEQVIAAIREGQLTLAFQLADMEYSLTELKKVVQ